MISARRHGFGRVRRVPWRYLIRQEWDQLAQAVLSIVFGIWGLAGVARLPDFATLGPLLLIFDLEFLVVGILLIIGLRTNSWTLRRRAFIVYAVALGMLATLLFISTRSPFSVLALAFTFQGIVTVRLLGRQEKLAMGLLDERQRDHGHRI